MSFVFKNTSTRRQIYPYTYWGRHLPLDLPPQDSDANLIVLKNEEKKSAKGRRKPNGEVKAESDVLLTK